ncbi:alpha/beta hydrolase family protein [Streptomyces glomeratus]|uniref:Alpha/beta hydrolase n=1 Tax=Streptomyces glomeratus TaxID=284452 RepID=A0ABP6KXZ6_9ACTN|nr:alpha/beta fold hydrolase [Streptomyces glomeratus]MCF1509000.1 alpha/beta fold hydrolase [Streptomyces glomeratus]
METSTPSQPLSPGVRPLSLDAAGVTLSCLLAEPPDGEPRATVVAVHGGGMTAGYFDGQAHPDLSLLTLGARLGFTVLALDRPGYGLSAGQLPAGQSLAEQAEVLDAVMDRFAQRHATGAGFFLLAHSYGGKVALVAAAHTLRPLALDVSGCGHRYDIEPADLPRVLSRSSWGRNWGPLRLYPPDTFRSLGALVAPMPVLEADEVARWPGTFEDLAPRLRIPVRMTFAEHEAWWLHGERDIAEITALLAAAPVLRVERQPDAGHNISLGWAARSYHLRALGFFEECLAALRARRGRPAVDVRPVPATTASPSATVPGV